MPDPDGAACPAIGAVEASIRYQQSENTRLALSASSQLPRPVDDGERRPGTFTFQK